MALVVSCGPIFLAIECAVKISSIHCSVAYLIKSPCDFHFPLKEMSTGNRNFKGLGAHEFPCFICSVNTVENHCFSLSKDSFALDICLRYNIARS